MQLFAIMRIIGLLVASFAIAMLPPLLIAWYAEEETPGVFVRSIGILLVSGLGLWLPARNHREPLRFREGFVVVVMIWVVLSMMAALPFLLSTEPELSWVDALFESTSGLTTTGATVLIGLDTLPQSLLFYRQFLQWLGGMGIIVLAVAVLPALGVGGMQLYRAESPGPVKDNKLTPRIAETAKIIWYIYLGLTVLCAFGYYLFGMTLFDAVSHAFSTVAIGGFSTHDQSLGYFSSNGIYLVATLFMLLAGLNFALHFSVLRSRRISAYLHDPEARIYFALIAVAVMVTFITLSGFGVYQSESGRALQSIVQVVSIVTTTGYATTDFSAWPTFLPLFLIMLSTAGGCAGSTAGGMKIIRIALLFRQGMREIARLVHPSALIPIKFGGKPVADNVVNAVWGFMSLYIFTFTVLLVAMLATGSDLVTSLSAVIACLNNLGPGLGEVAANYQSLDVSGKLILIFAMLLGRLELFTLLVLFTPVFWRG